MYALRDPNDSRYERARAELGHLRAQRLRLVVPFPTLIESHAGFASSANSGSPTPVLSCDIWCEQRSCSPLTEEDYRGAIRRVLRYPDQDISLVDALGAEIGDRLEAAAWTYDHHFDIIGARVWRR